VFLPRDAAAAIDPLSGIDFVTIGATYGGAGNPAWPGTDPPTDGDRAVGRGRVSYEYNIGKFEVTTAQWVEFFNAAFDRPSNDLLPHLRPPDGGHWGAQSATPNTPGARRWDVIAGQDLHPVGDISWRMAAMYCNWLHNGKNTDRSAFLNGAYDVSTFGFADPFGFSDQFTQHPDAKYWIPTWDEWLKAAHFDPNKDNGDGTTGGWWLYSTSSDTAPIYGRPESGGQANAGSFVPDPFNIPLGAYPGVTSPWGLLDTAGGTQEWTEEISFTAGLFPTARRYDGSGWATPQPDFGDHISYVSADFPSLATFELGFRIASAVPAPMSALGLGLLLVPLARRRRTPPCSQGVVHDDQSETVHDHRQVALTRATDLRL
jgi:formylglycine-generating enzyme required for sulfatase activity